MRNPPTESRAQQRNRYSRPTRLLCRNDPVCVSIVPSVIKVHWLATMKPVVLTMPPWNGTPTTVSVRAGLSVKLRSSYWVHVERNCTRHCIELSDICIEACIMVHWVQSAGTCRTVWCPTSHYLQVYVVLTLCSIYRIASHYLTESDSMLYGRGVTYRIVVRTLHEHRGTFHQYNHSLAHHLSPTISSLISCGGSGICEHGQQRSGCKERVRRVNSTKC